MMASTLYFSPKPTLFPLNPTPPFPLNPPSGAGVPNDPDGGPWQTDP